MKIGDPTGNRIRWRLRLISETCVGERWCSPAEFWRVVVALAGLLTVALTVSPFRRRNSLLQRQQDLEARVGIEPTNAAFAEPCLTTWLPRRLRNTIVNLIVGASLVFQRLQRCKKKAKFHISSRSHLENCFENSSFTRRFNILAFKFWTQIAQLIA